MDRGQLGSHPETPEGPSSADDGRARIETVKVIMIVEPLYQPISILLKLSLFGVFVEMKK